jgi:hypothetical protein
MTKSEQLAAAYTKLEEAGKLLRDAGEELLADEADQLKICRGSSVLPSRQTTKQRLPEPLWKATVVR